MEKPFKFFVLCNETKELLFKTNIEPLKHNLEKYVSISDTVSELKQVHTCYIDTRYDAKLRLYNYVTFTKNGLPIPKYQPFKGTEIGKSIPILNNKV